MHNRLIVTFTLLLSFALPALAISAELTGKVTGGSDGQGLAGAIVYAVSGPQLELAVKPLAQPAWNIRGGQLTPPIAVVQAGEPLTVHNADAVGNNLFIRFNEGQSQNRMMMPGGETTFETGKPELFARASDDLNKIQGYVCVLKHRVYALTDHKGSFKLPNLPPGTYTIEAAHPREGRLKREVTLGENNITADFALPKRPTPWKP